MLFNADYKLPENWQKCSQTELKRDMIRHMKKNSNEVVFDSFIRKMAVCRDIQFGSMCVRMSKKLQEI